MWSDGPATDTPFGHRTSDYLLMSTYGIGGPVDKTRRLP